MVFILPFICDENNYEVTQIAIYPLSGSLSGKRHFFLCKSSCKVLNCLETFETIEIINTCVGICTDFGLQFLTGTSLKKFHGLNVCLYYSVKRNECDYSGIGS